MPRLLFATLLVVALQNGTTVAAQGWIPAGPPGGAVRALAADPSNPDRLYLGTPDGILYASDDGGAHWSALAPGFPRRGYSLDQVVVGSDGAVYVGYWRVQGAGGGVARSRDGGRTFSVLRDLDGESVRALAIAPTDARTLAAGSLGGVFVSHDAGGSWERVTPPNDPAMRNFESLAFDPTDANVLYAGTWHLAWKTVDGGAHWALVHQGMKDDSDVMSLTVDRRDPRTLYATACTGVYRSATAGLTWAMVRGIPDASRRTLAFGQAIDDPALLLAGTTKGLWRSGDGGTTWKLATSKDLVVRAVLPRPDGTLLVGTEGWGVLKSEDHGATWRTTNAGFSDHFVSRLLFDAPRRRVFAAVQDGGVFVAPLDGNGAWQRLATGLEGRHVLSLARMAGTVFAGTDDGVFVRPPDARGWTRIVIPVEGHDAHPRVSELLALPHGRLLAGTPGGVLVSRDGGNSWSPPVLADAGEVRGLVGFAGEPGAAVAATAAGVFQSKDGGDTWTLASTALAGAAVHALCAPPGDRRALLAATGQGLYRSADRGATWRAVAGGLPRADLSALAVHPDGRTMWASDFTHGGLFRSKDGGATWDRVSTRNLPSDRVWTLGLDPASPERVFAASSAGLYVLLAGPVAGGADVQTASFEPHDDE